jgi:hypothetical protein
MLNNLTDLQFIKDRYAKARNQFKPRQIRTLLVVEAPPDNLERYFYFDDVKKQDSLFLEIMGVLYPEEKQQYIKNGRDTELKRGMLELFQEDGYFLINLSELPCSLSTQSPEEQVGHLLERLPSIIDKTTPIILIKASIFDSCYVPLTAAGYSVINERLPFPGSGQQRVFRTKFKNIINDLTS